MSLVLQEGRRYRHLKRDSTYVLIALAYLESDMTPVVVYKSEDTDRVWVRPQSEFCDGRFESI